MLSTFLTKEVLIGLLTTPSSSSTVSSDELQTDTEQDHEPNIYEGTSTSASMLPSWVADKDIRFACCFHYLTNMIFMEAEQESGVP